MIRTWMLKNDGRSFSVASPLHVHEDIGSLLAAASFLVSSHSADSDIGEDFLSRWGYSLIENRAAYDANSDELLSCVYDAVSEAAQEHRMFLDPHQVRTICETTHACRNVGDVYDLIDSSDLMLFVPRLRMSLNQEYCRVYLVDAHLLIEISSVCFRWRSVLLQFIEHLRSLEDVNTVTILRDPAEDRTTEDGSYLRYGVDPAVCVELSAYEGEDLEDENSNSEENTYIRQMCCQLEQGRTFDKLKPRSRRYPLDSLRQYLLLDERRRCVKVPDDMINSYYSRQCHIAAAGLVEMFDDVTSVAFQTKIAEESRGQVTRIHLVCSVSTLFNPDPIDVVIPFDSGTAWITADEIIRRFCQNCQKTKNNFNFFAKRG